MPFNSSTTRDDIAKHKENQLPGPGSYIDINNPIYSSVTKGILKFATDRGIMEAQGLSSGPFGTTEKRFKNGAFDKKNAAPGPGDYVADERKKDELEKIYEKMAKPRNSTKSSMFTSKTGRFGATSNGDPFIYVIGKNNDEQKPATAMAVLHEDENQANGWVKQTRSSFYTKQNQKTLGFNSTAPRWRTHRIVNTQTPGPGYYTVNNILNKTHGPYTANTTKRSRAENHSRIDEYRPRTGTNNKVGPGYYAVEGSMIKRSFNMSLDNSFTYL